MAAATIQVQSWQDISADLQAKCERWEQVNESTALALRQAKADATQLTLERREAEAKVRLCSDDGGGLPPTHPSSPSSGGPGAQACRSLLCLVPFWARRERKARSDAAR